MKDYRQFNCILNNTYYIFVRSKKVQVVQQCRSATIIIPTAKMDSIAERVYERK